MNFQHTRPAPVMVPLAKRRRTSSDVEMTDIPTLKLQSLPHEALKQILQRLHPSPCTLKSLRTYYPLRTLCTSLRDAFDAHLTSIELQSATPELLCRILPRIHSLKSLALSDAAANGQLVPFYIEFFNRTRARIRALTYTSFSDEGDLPHVLASYLTGYLEWLSTTSPMLLRALATPVSPLRTVELIMDEMDPECFPLFRSLSHVRLLYKDVRIVTGDALVSTLAQCRELRTVELRMHRVRTQSFDFLPRMRRLRKLSLFACEVVGEQRVKDVAACSELEVLDFEWMEGLNNDDLGIIAAGIGSRLRRLRISNCVGVDDRGLERVAILCPQTEVELKFEREQFSQRVLMMFGDRVSWGSYAI